MLACELASWSANAPTRCCGPTLDRPRPGAPTSTRPKVSSRRCRQTRPRPRPRTLLHSRGHRLRPIGSATRPSSARARTSSPAGASGRSSGARLMQQDRRLVRCRRDSALRSRQDAITVDDVPSDRADGQLGQAAGRPQASVALCGHWRDHQVRHLSPVAVRQAANQRADMSKVTLTPAQRHIPHRGTARAVPRPRADARWRHSSALDQLGVVRDRQAAVLAVADGRAGDDGHTLAVSGHGGHRDGLGDQSDLGRQDAAAAPAARRGQAAAAFEASRVERDVLHDDAAERRSAAGIGAHVDRRGRAATVPQLSRVHPAHLPDRGRARLLPRAVGVVPRRGGGDDPVDALRAVQGDRAAAKGGRSRRRAGSDGRGRYRQAHRDGRHVPARGASASSRLR